MLQVTPYTSLKLCGRTTELPQSDLNRQVIHFTRHALQVFSPSYPAKFGNYGQKASVKKTLGKKAEPCPALPFLFYNPTFIFFLDFFLSPTSPNKEAANPQLYFPYPLRKKRNS